MELELELEIFDDNDDLLKSSTADKADKKEAEKKIKKESQKSSQKDNS